MRLLVILLLVFCGLVSIYGQEPQHPRDADRPFTEAIKQLDLSPVQKEKVDQLREKYRDLMLYQLEKAETEQVRRERRRQLQHDFRTELGEILTPSQERELRMMSETWGRRGDQQRLVQILSNMDLSDEQRSQIRTMLKDQRPRVAAILQSESSGPDKQRQLEEVRAEIDKNLSTILTQQQYETLQIELKNQPAGQRHERRQNPRR